MASQDRMKTPVDTDSLSHNDIPAPLEIADTPKDGTDIPRSLCEAVGLAGTAAIFPIIMLRGSVPGYPVYRFAESLGWPFADFALCAAPAILLIICIIVRVVLAATSNRIRSLHVIKVLWGVGLAIAALAFLPLPSILRLICMSASYAVAAFIWRFATLNKSITKAAVSMKICCAGILVCIGCILPSESVPIFTSAMLIVSLALFYVPSGVLEQTWVYVPHEAKKGLHLYSSRMAVAVVQLLNAFAMGIIFCIIARNSSGYFVGIAFALAYASAVIISKALSFISKTLMRALFLTCSVACLVFIPYAATALKATLCLVLVIASFSYLTYYDWIHASMPKDDHLADIYFISVKGIVNACASFVGYFFAVWAFSLAADTAQTSGIAAGIVTIATCICMLYSMGAFREKKESLKTIEEKLKASVPLDTWEERVAIVAKDYGLTPRQTEILNALSRGRNAQYIMGRLYLSEGSVKKQSHLIYKKLDVHNQQDLITLVMNARSR